MRKVLLSTLLLALGLTACQTHTDVVYLHEHHYTQPTPRPVNTTPERYRVVNQYDNQ